MRIFIFLISCAFSSEILASGIQFEFPEFNGIRLFCPIDELKKTNAHPNCTDSAFKKSECSFSCDDGQKYTDSRGHAQPLTSRCTCQRAQCNWDPPLAKCRSIGEVNKRKLMPKVVLKSGNQKSSKKSTGWCVEFSQGQRSLVRSGKCFCPSGWKKVGGCVEPRVDRIQPCSFEYSTVNCTGNKLSEISQADENEGEVVGLIFDLIVPGNADEIIFKNSHLHVIPDNLLQGTYKLIYVDFSNNFLKTVPVELFRKTDLVTNIDLSFNQISFLPSGIFDNLGKLEVLDLSHNNLKKINQDMSSLFKLIDISLSFNNLEEVDENDLVLPGSVEYLHLQNNRISKMSPNIFPFALYNIDLSNNLLKDDFEESFKGAPNLVGLNVDNNLLEKFPTKKYPNLRRAELSGNKIKLSGGENLAVKMPLLEKLNLARNQITSLPATFLPEKCDVLKLINFKENGLTEIANDELACESLNHILFGRNKLTSIPTDLVNINSRIIDFSYNDIPEIADDFSDYGDYLRHVYMHRNNLSSFPRALLYGKPKLRDVDFSSNEITRIADADNKDLEELYKSGYLEKIDLRGNIDLFPFMNFAFVGPDAEEATSNSNFVDSSGNPYDSFERALAEFKNAQV